MNDDVRVHAGHTVDRVLALLEVGQVDRARQAALDGIAQQPDDPSAHLMLALTLEHADQVEPALEAVAAALTRDPMLFEGHMLRARLLMVLARPAASEQALRAAIRIHPDAPAAYATYAQLLALNDRGAAALECCERALSLDPERPWLHNLRATLLLQVSPHQWKISEQAVRQALRIAPNDPHNLAVLGMVKMLGMDNAGAEDAFRQALRLQPNNPLALRGLSEMVKGRSLLYRPMLAFSQLLSRLGQDGALAVVFGLWALYSAVVLVLPADPPWVRDAAMYSYLGFCAYTWFSGPVTLAILRRHYPWLR